MEIKKAFETMKKELKKEMGISGGFTMSAKQIENRTATYLVCNLVPWEKEIKYFEDACARVRGYSSWTDEEKARWCNDYETITIPWFKEQLAKFGTKTAYAENEINRVINSAAFAKFSAEVGGCRWEKEIKTDSGIEYVYIRFRY